MKPVTTGNGISGTFADELETLIVDIRSESGDQRWCLYIHALGSPAYSLRVYSPDRHTELHIITKALNTAKNVREVLVNEMESWQSRVRAAATVTSDDGAVSVST